MQIECVAHWEELYIRSYPLADTSAYARKLVDLPVTLSLEGKDFFLSYRRDLQGKWKVFCSDSQLREMRVHLTKIRSGKIGTDLEYLLAEVFDQVDLFCTQTLADKPMKMTRRDALVALIKEEKGTLLLHTGPDSQGTHIAYYHLGGSALVAMSCKTTGPGAADFEVLEVIEPTVLDWKLMCETLNECAHSDRRALESTVSWFFNALSQTSAVHIKSASSSSAINQNNPQALEC